MDFSLSEEQSLLKDSISKYIANDYSFHDRQIIAQSEAGYSPTHWAQFADLGWLSVPFAEDVGGYGGRIEDTAILFEEFGKGLILEPFMSTVLLAGKLLARAGRDEIVRSIIDGTTQCSLAGLERQSRQNFRDIATTARTGDGGFVLDGTKTLVINGGSAETFIVSTRSAGDRCDRDGISLFLVDANALGVTKTTIPTMDGGRVTNISFDNVSVAKDALLGDLDKGWEPLDNVIQEARIAASAEAVGIIDTLCTKTVEYAKTRTQFGAAIGSFQALQHRMVDMLMAAQQSRSILYRAICEYQQGEDSAIATIAAMKALIGKSGRYVGEEAIQLHGGMGITDELDIGHYVKRLMVLNQLFGDVDSSVREFSDRMYAA
jgi:alkylation response protein AidB-like acyl-CoA dehydrogenase